MEYDKLKQIIENAKKIVFFGGAGVSTESGIPDFRSSNGLYSREYGRNYSAEEILSSDFLRFNPVVFFQFYRENLIYQDAKPNEAHKFLAGLEGDDRSVTIITQNIDGLHQMAGSKKVVELHGSIHKNHCQECNKSYDLDYVVNYEETVPKCDACGGIVRPDVVLYGEGLDQEAITEAIMSIKQADLLICAGTSFTVYPAAGFVEYFRGENFVLINKTSTRYDNIANVCINDSIGKVFQMLK